MESANTGVVWAAPIGRHSVVGALDRFGRCARIVAMTTALEVARDELFGAGPGCLEPEDLEAHAIWTSVDYLQGFAQEALEGTLSRDALIRTADEVERLSDPIRRRPGGTGEARYVLLVAVTSAAHALLGQADQDAFAVWAATMAVEAHHEPGRPLALPGTTIEDPGEPLRLPAARDVRRAFLARWWTTLTNRLPFRDATRATFS